MGLVKLFLRDKLVIILKARQLGISWLICAYALWKARFGENVKVLLLSQGEDEAFDLISKCKFIDDNLPDFLTGKRDPDQKGHIGFPDTGSEIKALPSTARAGRSTDATLVICDEWEFHPHAEANFAALKPTIDAGGQFIGLSTADKTKLNTYFKEKYYEAMHGFSNFTKVFLGWKLRPGRTDDWFAEISKDYKPHQLEQEYPETEEEALSTLKTRKYFDEAMLDGMPEGRILDDIVPQKWQGVIKIFKLPMVGRKYCLFTDPSDGKEDPHACWMRDHNTGEQVATSHGMTSAGECAEIHDWLVGQYNKAWNSYELNSRAGGIFSEKIDNLGTPNQCPFVDTNGTLNTKGKKGWWTSKALKNKMLLGLEENIRLGQDTIYDKDCVKELGQFYVPEGEDPQAPKGGHDDYVMAGGGVIQIDKYMPVGAGVVKSVPIRERW